MKLAKTLPSHQMQPIDLVAPGFRGLNLSQAGALLPPSFATEALNAVIDRAGRLAARDGVVNLTVTPIGGGSGGGFWKIGFWKTNFWKDGFWSSTVGPEIRTLHEYVKIDGSVVTIIAYDGGISNSVTAPVANDISGAVVDSDGTWRFSNFNGKVLGFQAGQRAISYNGAGAFAAIVVNSGTAPTGGVGLAAYGRVWQLDSDLQTIKYSKLLDETRWDSADGGGAIDMRKVWTDGTDIVTAIAAFNGQLVIFGRNHIVFWADGVGSALGLDPVNMYVSDVIAGTGCITQHSIQHVGETDIIFLAPVGVQSIKRLIIEKSAPISTLTKYVRDELLTQMSYETPSLIRSTYNPIYGFYLLSFPTSGYTWVLDQRRRWRDEDGDELSTVTRWNLAPTALLSSRSNVLYLARTAGKIGQYAGDTDEGNTFRFVFTSPWLDLGEDLANRLKLLKRLGAILFVRSATTVIFKWSVDFTDTFKSLQRVVSGDADAEWGTAEFGLAEWSGGLSLRILKVPARDRAQYYRIGVEADVSGEFSLQQAELFAKIGRLA